MHCSLHFLNASNGPTFILWNISATLRESHQTILWGIFEKSQIPARDVFEMSQRCHGKDIFSEICFWDFVQKTSFLRCIWDVLKTSQESRLFWDVSERSLRCLSQWRSDWDLSETSHTRWVLTILNFSHGDRQTQWYFNVSSPFSCRNNYGCSNICFLTFP